MKKLTKGLILVLCAAVLVAGSVMGTLAWLTAKTEHLTNCKRFEVNSFLHC